jgi:hypothetical protein
MNIAALSMSIAKSQVQDKWGVAMLKNSLDLQQENGNALSEMLEGVSENMVNPNTGSNIDIRI